MNPQLFNLEFPMPQKSLSQAAIRWVSGLSCALALLGALPALAHEGHEHAAAPVALTQAGNPRASAASADFELVAELDGRQLRLYLDRYADNSPVLDASIEVESGEWKASAQPDGDSYRIAETPFQAGDSIPLIFTIQTPDSADLLETTLELPNAAAPAAHASRWPWLAAGAALLAGLALAITLVLRQRGKTR
jgi:cobalt-zinc-cadmium efflux system membrane fusion protein